MAVESVVHAAVRVIDVESYYNTLHDEFYDLCIREKVCIHAPSMGEFKLRDTWDRVIWATSTERARSHSL